MAAAGWIRSPKTSGASLPIGLWCFPVPGCTGRKPGFSSCAEYVRRGPELLQPAPESSGRREEDTEVKT
jgi:hypothetical protein